MKALPPPTSQFISNLVVNGNVRRLETLFRVGAITSDDLKIYYPPKIFENIETVQFLFKFGYMVSLMQVQHRTVACSNQLVWKYLKDKVPSHWDWNFIERKKEDLVKENQVPGRFTGRGSVDV